MEAKYQNILIFRGGIQKVTVGNDGGEGSEKLQKLVMLFMNGYLSVQDKLCLDERHLGVFGYRHNFITTSPWTPLHFFIPLL